MASLHLEVSGGLCSRLRALLGAMAYCDQTDKGLVVHWPVNAAYNKRGTLAAPLSDLWEGPFSVSEAGGPFRKDAELSCCGDLWLRQTHLGYFAKYLRRPVSHYFGHLRPAPGVTEWVRAGLRLLRSPTVGVQVRSWIKQPESPLIDWYLGRMAAIRSMRPDVRFYLSADQEADESAARRDFDSAIVTIKHGTGYAYDRDGVIRCAADLYVLRACDWVIGSCRSSYGQMVALIRGGKRTGLLRRPGCISGGRYEDKWHPPDQRELVEALGK